MTKLYGLSLAYKLDYKSMDSVCELEIKCLVFDSLINEIFAKMKIPYLCWNYLTKTLLAIEGRHWC